MTTVFIGRGTVFAGKEASSSLDVGGRKRMAQFVGKNASSFTGVGGRKRTAQDPVPRLFSMGGGATFRGEIIMDGEKEGQGT